MSKLYEGLYTEEDRKNDFIEKAEDLIAFKKMAGVKEAGALQVAKTMATHGGAGAATGGIMGAATAKPGESRLRRAAIGAGIGGVAGAGAGAARGVMKNRAAAATARTNATNAENAAWDAAKAKAEANVARAGQNRASAQQSIVAAQQAGLKVPQEIIQQAAKETGDVIPAQMYGIKGVKVKRASEHQKMGKLASMRGINPFILGGAALGGTAGAISGAKSVKKDRSPTAKSVSGAAGMAAGIPVGALSVPVGAVAGDGVARRLFGNPTLRGPKVDTLLNKVRLRAPIGGILAGAGLTAAAAPALIGKLTGSAVNAVTNPEKENLEKRLKELKSKEKKAAFLPANPTYADSSLNARSGELSAVEKTAFVANTMKTIARNPYAREAAMWGGAGATTGALLAPKGQRLKGALGGGAAGAAGGAVAAGIGKGLAKMSSSPMSEIRSAAKSKYPVDDVPSISEEALAAVAAARKQLKSVEKAKSDLLAGKQPRKVKSPIPVPSDLDKLAADTPLINPKALPFIGAAALGLGLSNYLVSRPKKSLGGKSSAEHQLQADVLGNKASATDNDGLPTRIRHRMKEFQSGLATDFRKSPLAAGGAGAIVGAGIGAQLAKVLGAR